KLRLTELSLVSRGANQFSALEIVKAADPEPRFPTVAEMASALQGASPEVLAIVKSQQDELAKILAGEFNKQESNHMTKSTADIVKAYMDRHDVSEMEAFAKVST